jgi:hypothetical protein
MKVAKKIIAEEGGGPLRKCMVELQEENSQLKAIATKLEE